MIKGKIKVENGKIVANRDGFVESIKSLDGLYIYSFTKLSQPKTIDEWRKYYFFLRDILYEDGETGYTKNELHALAKEHVLSKLTTPELFIENLPYASTSHLNPDGWEAFIKAYREWAFENFNCYL